MKLKKSDEEFLKEEAEKEFNRVDFAIRELKVLNKRAGRVMELVMSYKEDAEYFLKNKKYFEAFELCVYIFGLLDALANLELIDPGKARKHYKIEQ